MPLFKLVKKFQLGYSLELFGAQLILVYVVKVFCACKLPPRREVPAAQSTAVRHANELALQALVQASAANVVTGSTRAANAPRFLSGKVGVGMKGVQRAAASDQVAHHDLQNISARSLTQLCWWRRVIN